MMKKIMTMTCAYEVLVDDSWMKKCKYRDDLLYCHSIYDNGDQRWVSFPDEKKKQ